jgi:sensor c-di-GMP phosphodiesterase-like protein
MQYANGVRMIPLKRSQWLLYTVCILAVSIPLALCAWLAHYQTLRYGLAAAAEDASHTLARAHRISTQLSVVFKTLKASGEASPCSDANLRLMRQLVLMNNLLLDVGYVDGNVLRCSSFGREPVPIGPPSYLSSLNVYVRIGVKHPLLPGSTMVLSTDAGSGFTGLVHPDAALDIDAADNKTFVGLVGIKAQKTIVSHGSLQPAWLKAMGNRAEGQDYVGGSIIAWKRSDKFDYAALVVVPGTQVDRDWRNLLWLLMPVGTVAGGLLLMVVIHLARMQTTVQALLRGGLQRGELFLVYQPIVDLQTERWVGAEALIRWRRPNGEFVSPDVFIPYAERHNLIAAITARVLELLEQDAPALFRQHPDFFVAVNFSASDLCDSAMPDRVRSTLQRAGMAPHNLHIEATERVFLGPAEARGNVQAFRDMGVAMAIDDFGTGYSGLAYLMNLEMDALKIDKSFVEPIGSNAVTSHVVHHIIELAKSLGLGMVAEGVETAEQAEYLRNHGVQFGQGWYFGKPMAMNALLKVLRNTQQPVGASENA